MIKLFIVGFPRDMQEIELVEMFSVYGIVNTVTIVTDKESGKSLGYGFITMNDQAGAERAINALDGAGIDDRQISVRVAEDKRTNNKQEAENKDRLAQPGIPHRAKRPRRSPK